MQAVIMREEKVEASHQESRGNEHELFGSCDLRYDLQGGGYTADLPEVSVNPYPTGANASRPRA